MGKVGVKAEHSCHRRDPHAAVGGVSEAAIGSWPVDAPSSIRQFRPKQPLDRCSTGVVIKRRGALIEPARMVRVRPPEPLKVKMVAKLVAEGAEKRSEGSDLFENGGSHPDPNHVSFRSVIPEEFRSPATFTDAERPGGEDANFRRRDAVESGSDVQELSTALLDKRSGIALHGCFDGLGCCVQAVMRRNLEVPKFVTGSICC
jgi:hypothetical protein